MSQSPSERRSRHHGGTGLPGGRRGFSQVLLSSALVSRDDLRRAVAHADRQRLSLVDAVVRLGLVEEGRSYAAFAQFSGVPLIDLSAREVADAARELLPERVARLHTLVPLEGDDRQVTVASPLIPTPDVERDVHLTTGRRVRALLARRSQVLAAIERLYVPKGSAARPPATALEAKLASIASPVDLCDELVAGAAEAGATDVHIDASNKGVLVRYRVAGLLEPVLTIAPQKARPVISRYKVLAKVDTLARQRPQEGAFRLHVLGRPVDIRLSSTPTVDGETLVLRVLDTQAPVRDVASLGYPAERVDLLRAVLDRPDGLVLVTGPPGSGKSAVFYASLLYLNDGSRKIVTIEDPVERRLPGINQIEVTGRDASIAEACRSALRQDPNVIAIGDVREGEVAQVAVEAAYSGRLVLASLHASDAASAAGRLVNLGVDPGKLSETLSAVVSQRLVRRLCTDCRGAHTEMESRRLADKHQIKAAPSRVGTGCPTCRGAGFRGHSPVVDLFVPDETARDAIARRARASEIRQVLRAMGWPTLRDAALEIVAAGETTIDEVDRVLAVDALPAVRPAQTGRVLAYRR